MNKNKTTGNIPNGEFNFGDEYICDLGDGNSILTTKHFGIRPIITISKYELK